jgi:hypothetical protein
MATAIKGGQPAQKSEQPLAVLARGVVSAMALRLLVKGETLGKAAIPPGRRAETGEEFEARNRITPEQHQKLVGDSFALPGSLSKVREQRPGEEFSSYAREHAANWMRQEHPEADAQAYAEHFVNTYPEGNDESGNSIDHPTAHRIWKDSKESSKPFEVVPKSGRVAPASKPQPQRNKTFVVVPKSGITWMHGQRPKK